MFLLQRSLGLATLNKYLEILIKSVNKPDDNGNTPLHIACKDRNISIKTIEFFLKHGADPLLTNKADQSAFLLACANEKVTLDIIKLLYQSSLEIAKTKNNYDLASHLDRCLFSVCENTNSKSDMIFFLLDYGANVFDDKSKSHSSIKNGLTLLDLNNKEKLKETIRYKDKERKTLLHVLTINPTVNNTFNFDRDKPNLQILIDNGIDINATDNHGRTALHYFCENYQKKAEHGVCFLLLITRSDLTIIDKNGHTAMDLLGDKKNSLLAFACETKYLSIELIDTLLKNGGDLNSVIKKNSVFDHICNSCYNDLETIAYCLDNGANMTKKAFKNILKKFDQFKLDLFLIRKFDRILIEQAISDRIIGHRDTILLTNDNTAYFVVNKKILKVNDKFEAKHGIKRDEISMAQIGESITYHKAPLKKIIEIIQNTTVTKSHKYLKFFMRYLSSEQIEQINKKVPTYKAYIDNMPLHLKEDFKYLPKITRNRVATFFTCMHIHKKNTIFKIPPKPVQHLIAKEIAENPIPPTMKK